MSFFERFKQNQKERKIIEQKLTQKASLTIEEQYFMCVNLDLKSCFRRPECRDQYFYRVYLLRDENLPTWGQLSGIDRNRFRALVRQWEKSILNADNTDPLLHASVIETKIEIRNLKKEHGLNDLTTASPEIDLKYFELLAWSKFRYILTKKIFDLSIKADYYLLQLNGIAIRFDTKSCAHILTRHFAQGMKQYASDKDHFYDVFGHTDLHLQIEKLFVAIDASGLYVNDVVEDISFRYGQIIYKIYVRPGTEFKKGIKGPQHFMRLSTFFPVSDKDMLQDLHDNYEEKKINDQTTIFTRKAPII
jgi:hypothetical protein